MKPTKEQIEAGALALLKVRAPRWGIITSPVGLDGIHPDVLLELIADSVAVLLSLDVPPGVNAELLAACKAQHKAIDRLFAMLISRSPEGDTFYPSKSGQPYEACVMGNAAIAKAEGV